MLDDYVYARPRFNLLLFSVFAGFGLLLCLLGVYGVVSTAVAQRTREIGIRLALGARFHQVIGMVLSMGAKLSWPGDCDWAARQPGFGTGAWAAGSQYLHSRSIVVSGRCSSTACCRPVRLFLASPPGGARRPDYCAARRITVTGRFA